MTQFEGMGNRNGKPLMTAILAPCIKKASTPEGRKKYEKRYFKNFRNPDIRRFDMQHEGWMFEKKWTVR